jgi:hypothetical protein
MLPYPNNKSSASFTNKFPTTLTWNPKKHTVIYLACLCWVSFSSKNSLGYIFLKTISIITLNFSEIPLALAAVMLPMCHMREVPSIRTAPQMRCFIVCCIPSRQMLCSALCYATTTSLDICLNSLMTNNIRYIA